MKLVKSFLLYLSLSALVGLAVPCVALAQSIPTQGLQIHVYGVVTDKRTILVDNKHKIIEIVSNTTKNVTPEVHLMALSGPILPLTPDLVTNYQTLERQVTGSQIGIATRIDDEFGQVVATYFSGPTTSMYMMVPMASGKNLKPKPYLIYLASQ